MTKMSPQKFKFLENEVLLRRNKKQFSLPLSGLLVTKSCLGHQSAPLRPYSHFLIIASLVTLFNVGSFIRTVTTLVQLGILVYHQDSVRSQYLVRLLSLCWITDGHAIHPSIKELLPPPGTDPISLRNSESKVPGLQVHATKSGFILCSFPQRCEMHTRQEFCSHLNRIFEHILYLNSS